MKAAYVSEPGPAESLQVGELSTPTPGPGQVLVRVTASAVNPIDTYVRGGLVAMDLPTPYIPGCDFAGEVTELGERVTRFQVGDRVWGSNQGLLGRQGTLAEFAAIDEKWLYPTPSGMDEVTVAAGALVGITAHLGLVREAQLQPGETVLVVGGAGGVGSAVVQIAKALGARVIATAGGKTKAEAARAAGADEVIDYHQEAIGLGAARLAPDGVNVWWETRREADLDQAVTALAERGRMIVMAGRDARPPLPVGPFYVKGLSLHGFAMFKATPDEQCAAADDLNGWLAAGSYKPRIAQTFPLAEAAAAHELQESATITRSADVLGKIVVEVAN